MRAFRIILALAATAGTFYSLNLLAIARGYPDRLDFSNHHYPKEQCQEHWKKNGINHHYNKPMDSSKAMVDSIGRTAI
ncbi:hypothetical protein [Pedobacter sp.]|uniref:hypothetical protein n=1 Tax=Pedobacter sp. TaxID=1411316 RepID=UPI003BAA9B7C